MRDNKMSAESGTFAVNRREFCIHTAAALSGFAAMGNSSLAAAADRDAELGAETLSVRKPHFPARARRVIFLFMLGGPSQHDLFDYKPQLNQLDGQPIADEFLSRMKFAQITEQRPGILGTHVHFRKHGESGAEISELLPHIAGVADDLAIIKTVQATETPHHPAEVFLHTGSRQFGRPSLGAWINYGLGSESAALPGYVVLQSGMRPRTKGSVYGAGFLSSAFQGIPLRDGADFILNLSPPAGRSLSDQQQIIEAVQQLNRHHFNRTRDPETLARSGAYHLAHELCRSAPQTMNLAEETAETMAMYGADAEQPSFARNCLLARRLVEHGVRFVHLCHGDWDHHSHLREGLATMCRQTDQACAALIKDLKQRGLLEDTLIVWGGEFGRTPVGQKSANASVGRDHQISAFTMWMAGGGVRHGQTVGETDELGCFPVTRPNPIHDVHATILHLLGLDHRRLQYHFQGRDFRLTDVAGNVIPELI
ncbi:MAG: DUF1501 domain-containing protein [Planctomycetaceae bacterium]|nr:DUF1501 domain-containing protein [Planctomycetaceae bacterium]